MPISSSSSLKPAHFFVQQAKAETSEKPQKSTKPADASDVVQLKHKAAKLAEEAVDAYVKAVPEGKQDLNKFLDEAESVVHDPNKAKKKWLKKAAENPLLNIGITFGPQLSEAFVPTLPVDVRPVVFDFTDWLFAPETLPKHDKKKPSVENE
jgi:hypothetical protein